MDDHLAQKLPSLDETPSPRTPPVRRSSTEALTKLASASSARMPTEARAKEAELLEEALATSPVPPRKDQTNARASAAKQEARVHKGPPKAKEPKEPKTCSLSPLGALLSVVAMAELEPERVRAL